MHLENTKTNEIEQQTRPSKPVFVSAAIASISSLQACGGGDEGSSNASNNGGAIASSSASTRYAFLSNPTSEDAARFLHQCGLSSTEEEIENVKSGGYIRWLESQITMPSGISGWDWLDEKKYNDISGPTNHYNNGASFDYMIWSQLCTAKDTFRKRAALSLSEILVVSMTGLTHGWRNYSLTHYWDTLCKHALGNYRDLLEAVTLNVSMGYYLSTLNNIKENDAGRQPDENYAREVMQLFTIGLHELNIDGTKKADSSGNPIETYDNDDVSNLARVFTGYEVDSRNNKNVVLNNGSGGTYTVSSTGPVRLPMILNEQNHSTLAINFLKTHIAEGTPGKDALKIALDALFNHSNTAPFICKQLIQRMVTSNPSSAYVARVAKVFNDNGAGVRGDLAQVFSAIVLDDEARSPRENNTDFGKVREPMLRFTQWVRTFKAHSKSGDWKIGDLTSVIGQSPMQSPSVFNFFRPGYVAPSTVIAPALGFAPAMVAPEFQIVNESTVSNYINTMEGYISNGMSSGDIYAEYTPELAIASNASKLVERLNLLLCAGQLSGSTQKLIADALTATPVSVTSSDTDKRKRICAAILMVMASANYLILK